MVSTAVDFGIFRSLAHHPELWNWKKICGFLDRLEDRWDDPRVQSQLVPYLSAQLDRWPDELPRYAQHLWLHHAMRGREVPQLQFANAMQFISQETNDRYITRLFDSPHLSRITYLDLRALRLDDNLIFAVLNAASLKNLRTIDLQQHQWGRISPWLRDEFANVGYVCNIHG